MGRTGPVPNRPAGRRRARAARSETAVGGYKRPALGLTSGGTSLKRHHEECRQAQTAMLKPNGTRARRLDPSRTGRGMPSVSTVFEVRPGGASQKPRPRRPLRAVTASWPASSRRRHRCVCGA